MRLERFEHAGTALDFSDEENNGWIEASVIFATGEERCQVVRIEAVKQVREATVRRRIEKLGRDATPHKVIG